MALVYKCDVFCDRCADWVDGGNTQHGHTKGMSKEAREVAKELGWKRVRLKDGTYEDVCPKCTAKAVNQ